VKRPLLRCTTVCLGGLLLAAPAWSALPATPAKSTAALRAELLGSAQRWSDKNRTDVAREKIAKLLAIEPDSPEGLAFLGDLALRENKLEEARTLLATLQARHPQHPATRELRQLVQVYGTEREKLARMRLTARAGRTAEAAQLARELFPDGPPRYSALGAEIARITGQRRPAGLAGLAGRSTAPPLAARATTNPTRQLAAAANSAAKPGRKAASTATATPSQAPRPDPAADSAALAKLNSEQAETLRAQADEQIKAERLSPALRLLEDALKLTPDDPWLRYNLARLYQRLQLPSEARGVMDQGVARLPDDADMRYARALLLAALDQDEAALADLHRVTPEDRSAGMQALEQRLTVNLLVAQAADPARRDDSLRRAEDRAGNDPDLLRTVANAWFRVGLPNQGTALLQRRLQRAPQAPAELQFAYVQLLNRAQDDAVLSARLPDLLARTDWSAADRADLLAIHVDLRARQIAQATLAGDATTALALARAPLPDQPDAASPAVAAERQQAQARLLEAAGDYSAAAVLWEQALRQKPEHVDMRLALGNARYQQGQLAAARTEARWLQTRLNADDQANTDNPGNPNTMYRRLALLRLLQRTGDTDAARAEAQALLARHPTDVDVLLHAARLERSDNRYGNALGLFHRARQAELAALSPDQSPDPLALEKIDRDIEGIEGRRQAWLEVGQLNLEKNSTDGLSSLRGWERPMVAWMPWDYAGRVFAHIDPVQLDAGSYAGVEPFAQPGAEQVTRGVAQRADGLNLGVGYQGDNLRWDIGQIGIGFAVSNWVGGVRHSGDIGPVGYSLEATRRPLTGTLLSYAGTEDPISHAAWGGVVATGVGGRMARDFGPYSTSVSASVASLTGQNVADNSRLRWRVAGDHHVFKDPQQVVNVGLALSGQQHEKDLSGYTWGHGGYYSPTRNVSLSLPVEWSGRKGPLTWLLKASVSVSDSYSNAADYYPTNAAYQQSSGKVYRAGGSTGTGWATSGVLEYQVTRQLAIGAQLEREEADYYAPLNMLFYARFLLDPVREPLVNRPRPVQAYSQF